MLEMLDTAVTLETPEGTEIEVRPAGLFVRGLAFGVDELIRWAIIAVGLLVGGVAGLFGIGIALILAFATYWLYGVGFEVLNNGVTPGKRMQGLQVVHDDGTPVRLPASMIRNLVLYVDLLPAAYTGAIVSMLLTKRFRRLGDLAGGTMVVYQPASAEAASASTSGSRPPPFSLSLAEQIVIVDFLERSVKLTNERTEELARILADTLQCPPAEAGTEIKRIANGLRGTNQT
ncbi:MAG: RDD family protein [Gammaproteobacteria bacterium]|nr:RDD family protein [Gammaproteobacteria bacterium]